MEERQESLLERKKWLTTAGKELLGGHALMELLELLQLELLVMVLVALMWPAHLFLVGLKPTL